MNDRKEMIDLALTRMAGLTLERSSDGDNRSIFGLIETLIRSVSGETLAECRKPLIAVLSIKTSNPKERFLGCKLTLLQQIISTLFGDPKHLLKDRIFGDCDQDKQRVRVLEYLEICRRIFVTKYSSATHSANERSKIVEPEYETQIQRAWRLAMERGKGGSDS